MYTSMRTRAHIVFYTCSSQFMIAIAINSSSQLLRKQHIQTFQSSFSLYVTFETEFELTMYSIS